MFAITKDKTICLTRGDIAVIQITASDGENAYTFNAEDVIRLRVFERRKCGCVILQKDIRVTEKTETVDIFLDKTETKIGDIINEPVDYCYEVELNPDTMPQTIIGYDADGAKVFRLYPEGDDIE